MATEKQSETGTTPPTTVEEVSPAASDTLEGRVKALPPELTAMVMSFAFALTIGEKVWVGKGYRTSVQLQVSKALRCEVGKECYLHNQFRFESLDMLDTWLRALPPDSRSMLSHVVFTVATSLPTTTAAVKDVGREYRIKEKL
ncbi:uncharacterized protein LTR77_008947 [Saxophila tyrrhenica]|uniref:Uncharacterized protein n=1 Tax=Saxophila tyrrhenica TaxID=1690608 RepID=A0AAV9NZ33_9PEZI|nr:hypothetical protein LTR77_008947 [Saxophila tyrrhenica]